MENFHIGVVGYCPPTRFNVREAAFMARSAFDTIEIEFPDVPKIVVSGLTDVGVLAIAYAEARKRGWKTMGIACMRAFEHPLFPVDKKIIVGATWGDESPRFLAKLDCMVRIGMGKQAVAECAIIAARGLPTYEFDLPAIA